MENVIKKMLKKLLLMSVIWFVLPPSYCMSAERVRVETKENVRLSPNGTKVGVLEKGIWLQQVSEQKKWVNFQLTGWIYAESIKIEKNGELYVKEKENIRDGANGKKIGELNKGARLKQISKSGKWVKFSLKAWVWKDSLKTSAQVKKDNYEEGLRYGARGEFQASKNYFEKALEVDKYDNFVRAGFSVSDDVLANRLKKETAVPLLKGMTYVNEGFVEKSIKQYRVAMKEEPSYFNSYALRAMSYDQLGQYNKSVRDYNRAIKYEPNSPDLYYQRGVARANRGEYENAVTDFNSAIQPGDKNDKRLAQIHLRRGNAYQAQKNYSAAINDYTVAQKLTPSNPDIYAYRGKAYEQAGRKDIAALDFQKMNTLTNQNIVPVTQGQSSGVMPRQHMSATPIKEPTWQKQLRYQPPAQQIQQPKFEQPRHQSPPRPIQQPQIQQPKFEQPRHQSPPRPIQQPQFQQPKFEQPRFQPPQQQFQRPQFEQPKFNSPSNRDQWKP